MTHPEELVIVMFDIVAGNRRFDSRAVFWFAGSRTLGATLVYGRVYIHTHTTRGEGATDCDSRSVPCFLGANILR